MRRETYAALLYLLTGYFLISCHLRSVEKIEMHFDVGISADDEQTEWQNWLGPLEMAGLFIDYIN